MATTNDKPAIAVVHGAWHQPTHYTALLSALQAAGYTAHTMLLPSSGPTHVQTATAEAVVSAFRAEVLLPLLDAGRDAIVVGHSFGAFIGSAVIAGLGVGERQAGLPGTGAVRGFVSVAGFPGRKGQFMRDMAPPDQKFEWVDFSKAESEGISTVIDPVTSFYHDCSTEVAKAAAADILPQVILPTITPLPDDGVTSPAFAGRLAYIFCLNDRCVPLASQKYIVGQTGVEWIEKSIEGGHSPHAARPKELVRLMEDAWKDW